MELSPSLKGRWADLPEDIATVVSFLQEDDVCALGGCSRSWRRACDANCVWEGLFRRRWPAARAAVAAGGEGGASGDQERTEESNNLDDEAIVEHDTWVKGSSDNIHVYDFHIVYSFSYKVRVMYFQGHQAGGQLLTLDEIKEDFPSHSLKVLSESKWTFITREEHPHLSRPWFTLHPCGTSDRMKLLLQETKLDDKN